MGLDLGNWSSTIAQRHYLRKILLLFDDLHAHFLCQQWIHSKHMDSLRKEVNILSWNQKTIYSIRDQFRKSAYLRSDHRNP